MTSSKYQHVKIKCDRDWGRSILVDGILVFRLFGHLVVFRKTFKTWFAGKRKKMSIAAPSKSCLELFLGPICVFPGLKLKKKVFCRGLVCLPGWLKTLGKPSKSHQTCAERLESCITMWYMIPCARCKFEPESKLILTFWYFEDVISKWPKSLKYSIPLTKILRPQSRSSISMW